MNPSHINSITTTASNTITNLLSRLQYLEAQQNALLDSLHLTNETLETLPASIAPTFQKLPTYTAKLSGLKSTMTAQTSNVASLLQRAEAIRALKEKNMVRAEDVWERERERDKRELMAVRTDAIGGGGSGGNLQRRVDQLEGEETSGEALVDEDANVIDKEKAVRSERQTDVFAGTGSMQEDTVAKTIPTKMVVRRKKKVKQAEIEG